MREISDYTQALINDIKTSDGKFRHDNVTRHRCPECGKFLLEVNGKHGKRLVCQDRTCGYKRRFQGSQMPDVPYAIRRWKWSEKVKDRSLYVFAGIKKNCLHLNKEKKNKVLE